MSYNPAHFSNESYFENFNQKSRPRILVDKAELRQKMQEIHSKYMEHEYDRSDEKYALMKRMTKSTLTEHLFSSHEEIHDFFMWTDD